MRSFLFLSSPSSVFCEFVSSHRLLGLPTCLPVRILVSSPGCQSKTFLFHLFWGRVTILRAILHFVLLCTSIQHGILYFSICSSASLVLLLMSSIQSSSFSVASISSSASFWKDTSLSWSLFQSSCDSSSVSFSEMSSLFLSFITSGS